MTRRTRIALALACAAALAPPAAPAAAEPVTQEATAGAVTARFTFTDDGEGRYTGLALTVTRAGTPAYAGLPTSKACGVDLCVPGGASERDSVRVADLDADGEPEVLLDLYTGGAHCCYVTYVLTWTGTAYRVLTRNFGDVGYHLEDVGKDGRTELVTADVRFAYAFSAFAYSVFPVQVLAFADGKIGDVTRANLPLVAQDAERAWKVYRDVRADDGEVRGALAAWAADRYRLGHRRSVLARLRRMAARRQLPGSFPTDQQAFVRKLDKQLRAWGYARG